LGQGAWEGVGREKDLRGREREGFRGGGEREQEAVNVEGRRVRWREVGGVG
jgi:hypothetical protein